MPRRPNPPEQVREVKLETRTTTDAAKAFRTKCAAMGITSDAEGLRQALKTWIGTR